MRSYAHVLRAPPPPPVFPLSAGSPFGRLPLGINGLATVLFLRDRAGSFAVAGAAAGALALGAALGAPVSARVIDRLGPRALIALALVHGGGLAGLIVLGSVRAPDAALIAVAL